ncbi:uncharacterized protein LOC111328395 [Stylophora pistillata]|uniref:Uncharacterized protein n=1 Tax=Stylophora pistillata TaxID=50429 RepID=A0A2B4SAI0_STYPI|nr:uncharacterized protein LOC111328395 [Stylophora pistillata]PFX26891.1 hypothetical protein AWC38_SpisGene8437 [Stylophora pistillata]
MSVILTAVVLIGVYCELSNGLQKDKKEKGNKLVRFFQDNNGSVLLKESSDSNKDGGKLHMSSVIDSTEEKRKDEDRKFSRKKSLNGEKETKQGNTTTLPDIKKVVGEKENKTGNEIDISSSKPKGRKTHDNDSSQDKNKQKARIRQLLCALFNISNESEACKDKHHSKKAMIWPTRMIPWLKKVLLSKLSRGSYNQMPFLDDMNSPSESPFGGGIQNGLSDNWDSDPLLNTRRKHHHGLKMVPLLRSLKARLYGHGMPGNFGSLNEALNGEGLNGFGPMPTQGSSKLIHQILGQAMGSSDRNSVLNEMMQEFLLANNREETGGNEAFSDLAERNSFSQLNNGLQSSPLLPEPNLQLQGDMRTPLASEQPIHAQMLDNGAIAPMANQPVGNLPLKGASFMGGRSPIGRSPMIGNPSTFPSMIKSFGPPTSRGSEFQSSVLEAPQKEGSLLQRAGGFDLPISSSVLQHTSNPTQRMYMENEREDQGISKQGDDFVERNEASERRLPLHQSVGNNLVVEEISDNQARGGNLPMQTNPDLDRILRLHSSFRSPESSSMSKVTRLDLDSNLGHGLRLPVGSMGMPSVLSKDEDSINFNDLNNDRSIAFRRGKVLKGGKSLPLSSKKPRTSQSNRPNTKKSAG